MVLSVGCNRAQTEQVPAPLARNPVLACSLNVMVLVQAPGVWLI
jgi:hypothetical protein